MISPVEQANIVKLTDEAEPVRITGKKCNAATRAYVIYILRVASET
jgi:hypothetical protein